MHGKEEEKLRLVSSAVVYHMYACSPKHANMRAIAFSRGRTIAAGPFFLRSTQKRRIAETFCSHEKLLWSQPCIFLFFPWSNYSMACISIVFRVREVAMEKYFRRYLHDSQRMRGKGPDRFLVHTRLTIGYFTRRVTSALQGRHSPLKRVRLRCGFLRTSRTRI
jgi:hypothetical protein